MEFFLLFLKKHWKGTLLVLAVALSVMLTPIIILVVAPQTITAANAEVCSISAGELPDEVPERLNAIFTAAAKMYDVPPYVVALAYWNENGLAWREPPAPYGNGKPWATSSKGAGGAFQFMSGTWRVYRNSNPAHRPGNINDLTDSAYAAAHYLSAELYLKMNSAFGDPSNPEKGTVIWALGAYNAGPYSGFEEWHDHSYRKNAYNKYISSFAGKSGSTLSNLVKVCDEQTPDDPSNDDVPSFSAGCPEGSPASIVKMGNGTRIKVCRVNGMIVNAKIAQKWAYLVKLAKADGINLTGGGFRTAAQQIQARRDNCGPGHYNIYEKSPSKCHPTTARPGHSFHERALAVDLHNSGRYGNRVNAWMNKHAPKLGIDDRVPREPWHWSTGR